MNLISLKNIKEPFVLMLVGPPLVGKSFFCKEFLSTINSDVTIISRDQIVMDLYKNDNYDLAFKSVDQKKVNVVLDDMLTDCNDNRENVIVDMTNLTSKRRKHTLGYFDDDYNKIAIIFPLIEWDEIQKRNQKRKEEENKTIPEHIIKSMLASYQSISHTEGFNKVISL